MQAFYYTKQDLYGIARGRVERFHEHVVPRLMREGSIEAFDAKKHADAPGAADAIAVAAAQAKAR